MSQYLLSVHHGDDLTLPDGVSAEETYAAVDAFNTELMEQGAWVFAGGLTPASSATVVDGTGAVVDGPYLESKEYLGGFWVIDVADRDAALGWARKGSAACHRRVEVRPFQGE